MYDPLGFSGNAAGRTGTGAGGACGAGTFTGLTVLATVKRVNSGGPDIFGPGQMFVIFGLGRGCTCCTRCSKATCP